MTGRSGADEAEPRRTVGRRLGVVLGIVAAGLIGSVVVALLVPHRDEDADGHVGALGVVGSCVGVLGIVGVIAALTWAWRTGEITRARTGLSARLDRPTRSRAMRAIRGRGALLDHDREAAVAMARALVDRRWLIASNVSVLLIFGGQLLRGGTATSRFFVVLAAVLTMVSTVQVVHDHRRARQFLERLDASVPR